MFGNKSYSVANPAILDTSQVVTVQNIKSERRYDVDWIRTLALGLLIVYHVIITFQSWGWLIGFPINDEPLDGLWTVMEIINVWRIPILFLISGMGVRFAMERRNWRELLADRTLRILVPFIFGYFVIVPILTVAVMQFYNIEASYDPGMGHLWFLGNIFAYVLILLPIITYLKHNPDNMIFRFFETVFRLPLGLFVMAIPLMIEASIVNPADFVTYAETWHGFWLGLVCFFTGFILISLKDTFWQAVVRTRWIALVLAFGLYVARIENVDWGALQNALLGLESMSWMLAILGFGSLYLNHRSSLLRYLSTAVYPVYIVHLPVQFILAYYLIPLELGAELKLLLLIAGTFGLSFLLYEIIRRIKWLRPFFGMKLNERA